MLIYGILALYGGSVIAAIGLLEVAISKSLIERGLDPKVDFLPIALLAVIWPIVLVIFIVVRWYQKKHPKN